MREGEGRENELERSSECGRMAAGDIVVKMYSLRDSDG